MQVRCPYCQTGIEIERAGQYTCHQCKAIFRVDLGEPAAPKPGPPAGEAGRGGGPPAAPAAPAAGAASRPSPLPPTPEPSPRAGMRADEALLRSGPPPASGGAAAP